jgi:hypothetical protein
MKEEITSEIGKLVGLKMQYAGRASNLFWLGFGDIFQLNRRGKIEETAEYALHIQCSWRITLNNKIIVASRDFYSPNSKWDDDNDDDFEWDKQGNNRFDELIEIFMKNNEQLKVKQIDADNIGGVILTFSNGCVLEIFPDSSEDDDQSEHWRFFNRKENGPHFVVTGNGIDKV